MSEKAKNLKCVLFDVDGVLTNGAITYTSTGEEIKSFNAKDGFGINLLHKAGIRTGIITARESEIVRKRSTELKISLLFMGKRNKRDVYESIKSELSLKDEEIAYMGDDLLDLSILNQCGFSGTPANGIDELHESVDFISSKNGGEGAVREFCVEILKSQKRYDQLIKDYK
jgi:3-deoxy-D-manno-octulosonate 8-phosphate phosphatase (KDO 8-P phosphatase)